jgi:hypothetical protein
LTVNFGKEPFCFDIEGYILEEKMRQQSMTDKLKLEENISHVYALICSFRVYPIAYNPHIFISI